MSKSQWIYRTHPCNQHLEQETEHHQCPRGLPLVPLPVITLIGGNIDDQHTDLFYNCLLWLTITLWDLLLLMYIVLVHSFYCVFRNVGFLLLFMYGDANRSGDACHWKDSLLQFPRGEAYHSRPHGEAPGWVRGRRRRNVSTSLCVVCVGRDQQSRVSLSLDCFGLNNFSRLQGVSLLCSSILS